MLFDASGRSLSPSATGIVLDASGRPAMSTPQPETRTIDRGGGEPIRVEVHQTPADPNRVEVVRSYAYKLNLRNYGGHEYESIDLFCSEKVFCDQSEAEDASMAAYAFCRSEVIRSAQEIRAAMQNKVALRKEVRSA